MSGFTHVTNLCTVVTTLHLEQHCAHLAMLVLVHVVAAIAMEFALLGAQCLQVAQAAGSSYRRRAGHLQPTATLLQSTSGAVKA